MNDYLSMFLQVYSKVDVDFNSVKSFLHQYQPRKLLDLGAGFGRLAHLYEEVEEVTLIDQSTEMCEILNNKFSKINGKYRVVNANSTSLPFADNSFDSVIISLGTISEMSPIVFVVGEVSRVLKEGGSLYCLSINPNGYKSLNLGLERSIRDNLSDGISTECIPVRGKGEFQFEVQLAKRNKNKFIQFNLEQTCPDLISYEQILNAVNLKMVKVDGDFAGNDFSESSQLIVINAIKKSSSEAKATPHNATSIAFDNASVCDIVYNQMAEKYDMIASAETYFVPNWIKQQLVKYQGKYPLVLDCACATGNLRFVLDEAGLEPSFLYGVDVSGEMVKRARISGKYSSVIKWDLSGGVPFFRNNLIDISIANGCFEFIENPTLLLLSLFNASLPGGILLCTFEDVEDLEGKSASQSVVKMSVGNHTLVRFRRSRTEVNSLLLNAGWDVEEIYSGPGYVSPSTGKSIKYWFCRARKRI